MRGQILGLERSIAEFNPKVKYYRMLSHPAIIIKQLSKGHLSSSMKLVTPLAQGLPLASEEGVYLVIISKGVFKP